MFAYRRRFTGLIGCTALGAILLAGCGAKPTAAPAGGVVHIALWESHAGGPVAAAMSALVRRFDGTHQGVQVSLKVTKASKKALAAVAAGAPPVLAEISHYDGLYLRAQALTPWNPFFKGDAAVFNAANFFPAVWSNGTVGGAHYRLMADTKVEEFFYNRSLFSRAGITGPPATWTQLAADLGKLKAPGVVPLGFKDASAHILSAFLSNGGTLLKGGNSVGTAVDFNGAAGKTTFAYFRNLYVHGDLIFGHGTTLREDFAAGRMAVIDGTSAGYQKVLEAVAGRFPVGAFAFPAGSSGHPGNLAQGLG
ncbi:MAG: extracellular solute-binding protein, partial [Thermaerobacter sp.]|nr:extracellular solute-binding protein [Thermaerobacter sp.]